MGPGTIRRVEYAGLSRETVEETPSWRKRRRDLDLRIHPTRDVSHESEFPGFLLFVEGYQIEGGKGMRVGDAESFKVDRNEQLNSTT